MFVEVSPVAVSGNTCMWEVSSGGCWLDGNIGWESEGGKVLDSNGRDARAVAPVYGIFHRVKGGEYHTACNSKTGKETWTPDKIGRNLAANAAAQVGATCLCDGPTGLFLTTTGILILTVILILISILHPRRVNTY